MYNMLSQEFYWPHMANYVYKLVETCADCRKTRRYNPHQRHIKLFPACSTLDFTKVNKLGPLLKTSTGNQFTIVMTYRFSNLTGAVPVSKTTASHSALSLIDSWIMAYGIPHFLLNDNRLQFKGKLFTALCHLGAIKELMTTTYHPQTNGQTDWYTKPVVA